MPANVIGIDIDHYQKGSVDKRGAEVLAEWEARLGSLPSTWASTARGTEDAPGPSRTLFYRVPPGRYAANLGPESAIEILQRHHRYCVVAPSIHHEVGAPYRWYGPDGSPAERIPTPGDLPELPVAWVVALAEGATRPSALAAPVAEGAVLLTQLLADDRPECADITNIRLTATEDMEAAAAGSRHDTTTRRVYALVRAGAFGHTGTGPALAALREQWETLTAGENRGHEFDAMALSAARKALSELTGTGLTARAHYDPCLMMQVVAAPRPAASGPDDATEAPGEEILAPAAPTLWSRRALIGTEAFDPRGLIDHKLAAAALVRMGPVMRYLSDTGAWLVRGAHNWRISPGDLTDWAITELYELMPDGDPDSESDESKNRAKRKSAFGEAGKSSRIAQKMRAMVRTDGHPATTTTAELDADPEILWAGQLAWDLRRSRERPAMALVPSDTPHLHTAGVAPSGAGTRAPTPHWDAYTAAIWPDPAIREWALRVLSVALTGYADAVLPLLIGPTGAGKTSIINLIMSLLGTYGMAADPRLLVSADNAHASIVFALKGIRLAFIDEAPRRGELATARLKQLTGGAALTGNPMRGNPVTFEPTHTLVLTCNEEESPNFQDPALRRRVRLIPCEGDMTEVARTRRVITPAVWHAEAPGVLAKLMHYSAEWLAEPDTAAQYRAPEPIRWRAEDIAAEEDPVRQWIEAEMERCEQGTNATTLRQWFVEWFRRIEPRAPVMTSTLFGRRLTDLGYPQSKTREHGRVRPLRKRATHYGPPVPPPYRPANPAQQPDMPPLVTTEDRQGSADADGRSATGNVAPQNQSGSTDDHANAALGIEYQETSTDCAPASPEQTSSMIQIDPLAQGATVATPQTVDEGTLITINLSNGHDISVPGSSENQPGTGTTRNANPAQDQDVSGPAIISSVFDIVPGVPGYSPLITLIGDNDLTTHQDRISAIGRKPEANPEHGTDDLTTPLEQAKEGGAAYDSAIMPAPSNKNTVTDTPLEVQEAETAAQLAQARDQRNQLTKLIKKTPPEDPLHAIYAYAKDQLVATVKEIDKRLRGIRSALAKTATIAELGGDLLELPAHKTRHGATHSVSIEVAGQIVRAAMTNRVAPGRLTVDIESTGYPIGHPDHAVRTVQLGNRDDAVVFDVADPVQFATCVVLLAQARELEAYSAAVEISHLAALGMIDYRDGWARAHDVVIKAQLHNPVGTLSSDAGLKPQSELHLSDPVSPGAEARRAQLFRKAGWTTDTKVRNSGIEETGGWVAWERSGWAQVNPRCRTQADYAVSDVLDCAALGETLPMPAQGVYDRERAVQAAVGAVSFLGLRLDREHIEAKIAEHTPARDAARRALTGLGIDNPGSNDQIAAALLARGVTVGPHPGQLPLGEKSGKPSVAADVLARLPRTDALAPVIDTVLDFRKHNRLLTAYLGPYHLLCTHGDGRMRSTVYTLQADTGRMSCVHENLQNIPSHGGIRECFIADPGELFIDADLFGIEVAVLAALSQDQVLLDLVASGRKLHKIIAVQVYGPDHTTRQYGYVKNGVFAKLYGAGIWRIANTVGCSEAEAQRMVDALDELAPGVKRWGYQMRDRVKDGMDSITLYSGRVLRLPREFPHKIVNYLVQGTARETLVDGLLRWRYDTKWGRRGGILVPVHDEILANVPAAEAPEAMNTLIECMSGELYGVKIKAEPKWKVPSNRWLSNDHELSKG